MLIDDVYSGGSQEDGDYMLLSQAMEQGLYHPRCRHGLGTYYPELEDINGYETEDNKLNDYSETVDNSGENDIIKSLLDMEIDKFVPCLEDACTGEILPTEVARLTRFECRQYTADNGWGIDWSKRPVAEEIFGVFVKGSDKPEGLISLRYDRDGTYIGFASTAPHNNKRIVGNNQRYYGVGGHLFSLAVEQSLKHGTNGTLYGYAVNQEVLNHYIDNFGAYHVPIIHEYQFIIEGESSKSLLRKYNYEHR